MKGSPLSLVSKLWALRRFNARHNQQSLIVWWQTAGRDHVKAVRNADLSLFLPSSILCVLHFTPFYREKLIFTLWERKIFGGEGKGSLSFICPSFSPKNDIYLFWNSLALNLDCVIPLKQILENWTFESGDFCPACQESSCGSLLIVVCEQLLVQENCTHLFPLPILS